MLQVLVPCLADCHFWAMENSFPVVYAAGAEYNSLKRPERNAGDVQGLPAAMWQEKNPRKKEDWHSFLGDVRETLGASS